MNTRTERVTNVLQIAALLAVQGGCWFAIGMLFGWLRWGAAAAGVYE